METNQDPKEPQKMSRAFCATWIAKIAAAANAEVSKATVTVYLERLMQLDPEALSEAGRRTIEDWGEASKMPPLKFIIERAGTNAKLSAEQAWEFVLKLVKRDWYADGIGWVSGSEKKLSPAMQYAIRQCGGEHRMAYSTEETFAFIRRDFIGAHERFEAEGGAQIQLTQGEARQFLDANGGGLKLPEWPK